MSKLRVGMYITITSEGESGGVEQFIIGLVEGLSQYPDNDLEFVLITHPFNPDWIKKYAGENMHVEPRRPTGVMQRAGVALGPIRPKIEPVVRQIRDLWRSDKQITVPTADPWIDSFDLDLIHFPTQQYVRTGIDSVYNPHDLQHRHYPEYFDEKQIRWRETIYRTGCEEASVIAVASQWIKDDIVDQYNIDPSKIVVIPTAPPVEAYPSVNENTLQRTKTRYNLPDVFGFYPAQSWPHKNHKRLVKAIAHLRDEREVHTNLVFSGKKNDHWTEVAETIAEYDLEDQIFHLGFVNTTELRALYQLSTFTIIPTLFEAASLPMFEAWHEGSPVACSNATSLPEFAGDSAEMFDPKSITDIADAIDTMVTDTDRRQELVKKGKKHGQAFTWRKTAAKYVEVYQAIAEGSGPHDVSDATVPINKVEDQQ